MPETSQLLVGSFSCSRGRPPNGVDGIVTFTHFTCQPRCALKDRNQENQSVKDLEVRANLTGTGLFLASVTMLGLLLVGDAEMVGVAGGRLAVISKPQRIYPHVGGARRGDFRIVLKPAMAPG